MTKGRRLQLPSGAFARGGRGRRGAGGRGRSRFPDRTRMSTHDLEDRGREEGKEVASDYPRESQRRRLPTGPFDFQDPIGGRESVVPLGGSACGSSSSMTPASYAKERFKFEMIDGHRVELDSSKNILPRDLRFAGPRPKICGLPYPDDGFIYCEYNTLALAQAMANVSLADQKVYRHETKGRMAEWMGRDLNWNLVQELTAKYNESQDSVRRLEGGLKKEKNQSTSRLRALENAQSKCGELEQKIERLEKRIAELE
ncbi:hypothetical protein Dimus_008127 [Dionaea muscipula]